MEKTTALRDAFIVAIERYLLDENLPRVIKCLEMLDEEQVWFRPNAESNSVGNLVLHLAGNLNQWVLKAIGGKNYKRKRDEEFTADKTKSKEELIEILVSIKNEFRIVVNSVTEEELLRVRPVQIYEEDAITILIHVTEHFSYHTGQIAYITKWLTCRPTGFYGDLEEK